MLKLAQNGYSDQEVLDSLRGRLGSRSFTFRYDQLSSANAYVAPLASVLGGSVSLNNLADIQRTARFEIAEDGQLNYLSDRIQPWARLAMPRDERTYTDVLVGVGGALLHWKLDEVTGTTAADSSGASHPGTIGAGITLGKAGLLDSGSAMDFAAGNAGITATGAAAWLNGLERVTVVAWLRSDAVGVTRGILNANTPGSGAALNLSYMATGGAGGALGVIQAQVQTDHGTVIACTEAGTQSLQTQCVIFTWTAGMGIRVYVNGEPAALSGTALPSATGVTSGSGVFTVGVGSVAGREWDGIIDDVSIFAASVTDDQARDIWAAGAAAGKFGAINYAEWPLGVFLLSSPTRHIDGALTTTRTVEAYDQLLVYSDDKVSDRYSLAAGTFYTENVRDLLAATPSKSITNSTKTLPAAMEWEPGTPKLTIINDLLSAVNYRPLSFDENGSAIVTPYQSPAERTEEYTYADDETSVISPEMDQTLDLFSIPNKWTLVVSSPDRPALVASYTNTDPTSLTSTVRRGRTIVDFRTEQDAVDLTTLQAKAARLAFEASQVFEDLEFETAIMPIHSTYDVYRITYSSLGIDDKYSGHTWEIPLQAGRMMKHSARRVVQV